MDFDLRNKDIPQRASPVEDLTCVTLSEDHPSRMIQLGSLLSKEEKEIFLCMNQEIFCLELSQHAWDQPQGNCALPQGEPNVQTSYLEKEKIFT